MVTHKLARGCGLEEAPPLTLKLFESALQLVVVKSGRTWHTGAGSPAGAAVRRARTAESRRSGGVFQGRGEGAGREGARDAALQLHEE